MARESIRTLVAGFDVAIPAAETLPTARIARAAATQTGRVTFPNAGANEVSIPSGLPIA